MVAALLTTHAILLVVIVILLRRVLAALCVIDSRTRRTFWSVDDVDRRVGSLASGVSAQNQNRAVR